MRFNFIFYKIYGLYKFKLLFLKIHEERVMGVGIDALNNVIFSAGEDKKLKITNLIDHKIVFGS